jgi:hypothetical protein
MSCCINHSVMPWVSSLQELHAHVEQGLGRNLQARCSTALQQGVDSTEKDMTGRFVYNCFLMVN